jgi:hypothetical protein
MKKKTESTYIILSLIQDVKDCSILKEVITSVVKDCSPNWSEKISVEYEASNTLFDELVNRIVRYNTDSDTAAATLKWLDETVVNWRNERQLLLPDEDGEVGCSPLIIKTLTGQGDYHKNLLQQMRLLCEIYPKEHTQFKRLMISAIIEDDVDSARVLLNFVNKKSIDKSVLRYLKSTEMIKAVEAAGIKINFNEELIQEWLSSSVWKPECSNLEAKKWSDVLNYMIGPATDEKLIKIKSGIIRASSNNLNTYMSEWLKTDSGMLATKIYGGEILDFAYKFSSEGNHPKSREWMDMALRCKLNNGNFWLEDYAVHLIDAPEYVISREANKINNVMGFDREYLRRIMQERMLGDIENVQLMWSKLATALWDYQGSGARLDCMFACLSKNNIKLDDFLQKSRIVMDIYFCNDVIKYNSYIYLNKEPENERLNRTLLFLVAESQVRSNDNLKKEALKNVSQYVKTNEDLAILDNVVKNYCARMFPELESEYNEVINSVHRNILIEQTNVNNNEKKNRKSI